MAKGTLAGGALRVPMEHEILYTLLFPYRFFDSLEASIYTPPRLDGCRLREHPQKEKARGRNPASR